MSPNPTIYGDDFVIQVFTNLTGMTSIPRNDPGVFTAIDGLRSKYTTIREMVDYLRPFWNDWITRRTRDGRMYAKTNFVWLTDWAVSGEIPEVGSAPKTKAEEVKANNDKVFAKYIPEVIDVKS